MPAIEISNARRVFRSRAHAEGLLAYTDVTFSVEEGEFLCLLGPSGCGKSSLLNAIAGLDRDVEGEVRVHGVPVYDGDDDRHANVGYVFQEPRLLPWTSVEGNLKFALRSAGVPQASWAQITGMWLERVGLAEFRSAYPHELSGGMQQRVAIARAFAVDPDVLLMDEPFGGLDEFTARAMREHVLELWESTRKTVVFVTHNCFEASFLADRIIVLSPAPGRIDHDLWQDIPRPRDYDDTRLFERSVAVTRLLTERVPA